MLFLWFRYCGFYLEERLGISGGSRFSLALGGALMMTKGKVEVSVAPN